jgi:hypothetical protein
VYYVYYVLPVTFVTTKFRFIKIICQFLQQFSYTTPFLLYIISGHVFRKELIQFIKRILGRRFDNQVQPVINHIHTNAGDRSISAIILKHFYHR